MSASNLLCLIICFDSDLQTMALSIFEQNPAPAFLRFNQELSMIKTSLSTQS
jgi:hypothetical protein